MTRLQLRKPDVALFSDPVGTRVELPRMTVLSRQVEPRAALVSFEGYDDPVLIRGAAGRRRPVDIGVSYFRQEHQQLVALLALLERLQTAPDGRLQVRSVTSDTPGLDGLLVVGVTSWSEVPARQGVRTVSISATRTYHSLGV